MKVGDIIVYGNGERDEIIGMPKINKQPGLLLKPLDGRKATTMSDTFQLQARVQHFLDLGTYRLEHQSTP